MKSILIALFLIIFSTIISIEELRIDMREYVKDKELMAMSKRDAQLNHKFNLAIFRRMVFINERTIL